MPLRTFGRVAIALGGAVWLVAAPAAQTETTTLFRVFLADGRALPSFGDYAIVDDRIVFTLSVGASAKPHLQLMSVPVATVDLDRTANYSRTIRAAHYASTRGEADYAAMTGEVSTALDHLSRVDDPKQRLALAEQAKRRLLAWSAENFSYRADDIKQLAGLFDEVIAELRAAAGESSFSLDLSAGPDAPRPETLLPAPGLVESIRLAIAAAGVTDLVEERLAILRAALESAGTGPATATIRVELSREIAAESNATAAYQALATTIRQRAEAAAAAGDVQAIGGLTLLLARQDEVLGRRRPAEVQRLRADIAALLDRAVARRLALDGYAAMRGQLLVYERKVRPAMSGLDGLRTVMEYLRDERFFAFARLETSIGRLAGFIETMKAVAPPAEVADIHATLTSALHMAQQACQRRRLALVTSNAAYDREASAAAAGALLLSAEARRELVARLLPPGAR